MALEAGCRVQPAVDPVLRQIVATVREVSPRRRILVFVARFQLFLVAVAVGAERRPVAAFADVSHETLDISLTGLVASPDGKRIIEVSGNGNEPIDLGKQLAQEALNQGAAEILQLEI